MSNAISIPEFYSLEDITRYNTIDNKENKDRNDESLASDNIVFRPYYLASSIVNRLIMTFTPRRMNIKSIYIQYQDDKDSIIVDSIIRFYRCLTVFWKRKQNGQYEIRNE